MTVQPVLWQQAPVGAQLTFPPTVMRNQYRSLEPQTAEPSKPAGEMKKTCGPAVRCIVMLKSGLLQVGLAMGVPVTSVPGQVGRTKKAWALKAAWPVTVTSSSCGRLNIHQSVSRKLVLLAEVPV